ncbi:Serine/threonine protein phosphatase PrpC [Streptoalloteichus tenebrarius]|uniref:Serine/threonine protein phosphatase PrpC n=1 Tax=Streptoalloteichus tenebrarius (strain ATCC 17920 / DSM 40477 / JCM 4838 / CBS 697.72 / NBRC 16177 / NCIMB 11028 / NRRL B-12390 / A12253. 1 / ISP 5477) TaxID=1933 RepID=A0ABT1HRT1_STRSD|nr:hypothetical protein [Streptoalloteichus tenebrarius]MCP2258234.1 Serine/threonine protein phosphatase PrpC [Streptoalloteichus tenebrarius]BFF04536.1 hypothetical protein GCM10020241_62110 [Streptoalloteichus tenebrarius]
MTTPSPLRPRIGTATEQGPKRPRNADAVAYHTMRDRLAVAVVDGTGSRPEVVEWARDAAATAARVAARRASAVLGIVAASDLCDPDDPDAPDGAIVVATAVPDGDWLIGWAGDCQAIGWDGDDRGAWRLTAPHTEGQRLRDLGASEEEARPHDRSLLHAVASVPRHGIAAVTSRAGVLVLSSDGLHRLPLSDVDSILTAHAADVVGAAEQLVKASRAVSTDDITAAVVVHPHRAERR